MLDVDLSKEQRNRSLEMVMRNTLRLDRLIQDILEISRIQSGRLRIVKRKENFEFVLEEAINMIKPLANEKKVKIDVKIDHIPKIPIDKDRIIEVLTNLIHNALNYGDRKNRIKVIVKEERGFIKVSVKDKGKGIKEENLQNIFKPFFRERSVWESKIEGSGLGLSICRGIVRSHGGEIGVKSVLKKGSEFYFTLPIKSKKIKIKETEVL